MADQTDPREYWNDPATTKIALELIAHTCDATVAMKAAGQDAYAVADVLLGNLAHLIATNFEADEDEDTISTIAWALNGKLKDARQKLPGIQAIMAKPGNA